MPTKRRVATPKPAKPAESERQFKALMRSDPRRTVFIRTLADWQAHVRQAEADLEFPLHGIDPKAIRAFEESLVFGESGGLAGVKYGPLAEAMSFRRFRGLMGLFGLGLGYFADHDNKYCAERATCRVEYSAVCTSNC